MKIAIVKYNAGNTQSVIYALNRLGIDPEVTDDVEKLRTADKVIFPGVGEASTAMDYLNKKGLSQVLKDLHQPFLGICLGLQLMCEHSEENDTDCLGIFPDLVKRFNDKDASGKRYKVPHMGWNSIYGLKTPLFDGIDDQSYVYFVHSYYAACCDDTIATCDYNNSFSAALHKDNYYAVQFHPEKSGDIGAKLLENFISL